MADLNDAHLASLTRLLESGVDLDRLTHLASLLAPTFTPELIEVERVPLTRAGALPAKAHLGAFPPF